MGRDDQNKGDNAIPHIEDESVKAIPASLRGGRSTLANLRGVGAHGREMMATNGQAGTMVKTKPQQMPVIRLPGLYPPRFSPAFQWAMPLPAAERVHGWNTVGYRPPIRKTGCSSEAYSGTISE